MHLKFYYGVWQIKSVGPYLLCEKVIELNTCYKKIDFTPISYHFFSLACVEFVYWIWLALVWQISWIVLESVLRFQYSEDLH